MTHEDALVLRDVRKSYGDFTALTGVSLAVRRSEIVCLVGPSGCGKSTLLNIIAGFEKATGGDVLIGDRPITGPGPDRAVVFQQDALFPWLRVFENVTAGARARRTPGYEARAAELLRQVRLDGFRRSYPYQLSGGMRQRASIARALMSDSKVLLMDEPFGALDAQTRGEMQGLLQEIWASHRPTIVFITHDIEEALVVGDRVVVMGAAPGRILETLDVGFPRPRSLELTTRPDFNEMKRRILRLLHPEIYAS
ncbi:ABC transporter ATP-binding protein [Actinomadura chibensis]|uniref:ABC transporter ATP-binding protein n=1 Tax=Actinomadura chibensis TaxID=392828 RepID=A0A5D0NCR5_9ACTN|nr:ABC transporter ATP-binding protein [Actinomadura chibensis]